MKIVKYKKEKSGKYKVYLEDGSTLTTYEDVIINNNLLYHNQIDDNLKEKLENESNYQKIYNTCIKYISVRVRSTKEVKDYLYKKNIDEETRISIIERLKNNKLLNDEVFTELFIKDKLNLTNDGEYKIINSLKEHGISSSIIDKYTYLFDRDLLYKKIVV